jgi:hypothetical protein
MFGLHDAPGGGTFKRKLEMEGFPDWFDNAARQSL